MRVSVLGTGTMGAAMARNLARAGHEVRAWNRSPERAQALSADGVQAVESPAQAIEDSDAFITMLADGDAVLSAVDGALGPRALWIQMSTTGLEGTERCATLAENAGVGFIDAPVLGTKEPAEQGELIVLASGPEDAHERCQPLFDAIGKRTIWLGQAGEGTRLKLVCNSWIISVVEGLAETFRLAEGLDVDPARFLDAIGDGPLDAGYVQLKGKAILASDWEPSFTLQLGSKDARLVGDAAARHELDLPVLRAIAARLEDGVRAGHGDKDLIATYLTGRG